jgi:peptidoglycan/xylan/chitin deacetylase (PgdA/CDA1 family)
MLVRWGNGHPLPLLTYHSIDDCRSVLSTSPGTFRRQLQFLASQCFHNIRLSEVVQLLHDRLPLPPKRVCLTFDDGYQNVYSEAFPLLQEYGFTATVFLVARYCGRDNDWPGNLEYLDRTQLLSWDHVKEMSNFGIDFGAHTLTHPDLTCIAPRLAEQEIVQSKQEIEDKTGQPLTLFAYPYGRYNSHIREVVRGQFLGACTTRLGNVRSCADPYRLRRIDSWFLLNVRLFSRLTTRSLACYLQARQAIRELKALL